MKQRWPKHRWGVGFGVALVMLMTTSCGLFHLWPYGNQPVPKLPVEPTRANFIVEEKERADGMFVGLALSGGGSRSSIFATQVMLELKRLGILQKVDFLSSVSGGSLPAAYYALDGFRDIRFEEPRVLEVMGRNFQHRWLARWFLPWNIVRYWTADFTRSDIMVQVFDNNLFDEATYHDLRKDRPKLLINSTNEGDAKPFIFRDEEFATLNSDLHRYEVARAVNVSSAFPGVFQTVTLTKYSPPPESRHDSYYHLYDGGPVDNLGVDTLYKVLAQAVQGKRLKDAFPKGCVIIAVDAAPQHLDKEAKRAHIREWIDYIVDRDALNASDVMLSSMRREVLGKIGFEGNQVDDPETYFRTFFVGGGDNICHAWHLALRKIPTELAKPQPPLGQDPEPPQEDSVEPRVKENELPFGTQVATIETSFGLSEWKQWALRQAARWLVAKSTKQSQGRESPLPFLVVSSGS